MRQLPVTYRIPKAMIGYLAVAAFACLLPLILVLDTSLPNWLEAAVALTIVGGLAVIIFRVVRMGTVITTDGITRRGFLGDRHYRWPDIRDFYLHVNPAVAVVGPFQVTSQFVVCVYDNHHQRRRKTLFFLDERAFPTHERFQAELNELVQLWQQRRDGDLQTERHAPN